MGTSASRILPNTTASASGRSNVTPAPAAKRVDATSYFTSLESGLATAKACEELLKEIDNQVRETAKQLSEFMSTSLTVSKNLGDTPSESHVFRGHR